MTAAHDAPPEHGAHEQQPSGLWARHRARYDTLPPAVQMIGLQLWLPVVFVVIFCFCYIGAFHSPSPHHVPVAVVGSGQRSATLAGQLQGGSDGALQVRAEPSIAAARADVRNGDLAAAYVPGTRSATLIVASADSYQRSVFTKATFGAVATRAGVALRTEDLAPLPKHDAYGITLFYVTLVLSIAGYMSAMFVGMMGGPLTHRVRIGILAVTSTVLPLIVMLITRFVLGAVTHGFWPLWGIGVATAFAIGLIVNGLGYFFGRFVTAVALLLFVFLNVPSAGGAYPPEFLPRPFRDLHHVVSGTGTVDALRSVVYDVGPGVGHGMLILGCYAAAGLALTLVGKPYHQWRLGRRARRGTRPGMMITAQLAAMAANAPAPAHPGAHAVPDDPADVLTVEQLRQRREADEEESRRSTYAAQEADGDAAAAVTGATA